MRISSIGHAGFEIRSGSATILVDPWFSPEGAFLGSWFPYPNNEHLLERDIFSPDAIVISHEHLDHVDPWFLARVPRNVPVFIPKYPSQALPTKILSGGERRITEVEEWVETEVAPGLRVFFISEESPMNHDSAMVIRTDEKVLLNLNDARLTPSQIRNVKANVGGNIDALSIQGAGASWFPVCYDYDDARRRELSVAKRKAKLTYEATVHEIAEPVMTLPFAGPPAFLDDALRHVNVEMGPEGIFPDQEQVAEWMAEQGITDTAVLLPGDVWDATSGSIERDPHWADFRFDNRESYIAGYAERRKADLARLHARYPTPDRDLWEEFNAYFDRVLAMSPYFNENIDMKVGFELKGPGGGDWSVDFRPGHEGITRGTQGCHYVYTFESRWLPPILDGSIPWEDFFLSLRFTARRDPDHYNDHLLGLLKFAW
ncbi:MAG: MBL fold metallo-hydrolase, partial [Acidimicrobiia bacterium]|nr:MBL fold metallo-hydrolase [Acidimicrobiia bacterium]